MQVTRRAALGRCGAGLAVAAAAAAGLAPSGCTFDECSRGEARCDGNVAYNCELRFSDSHGPGNPYEWYGADCSAAWPAGAPVSVDRTCAIFAEEDGGEEAGCSPHVYPMPALEGDRPILWNTNTVAFGAESITWTDVEGRTRSVAGQDVTLDISQRHFDEIPHTTALAAEWTAEGERVYLALHFEGDEDSWWLSKVRTNGGRMGEDIYYEGPAAKTPITEWFTGDIVLEPTTVQWGPDGPPPDAPEIAPVELRGLELRALW